MLDSGEISKIGEVLVDPKRPLKQRFRALFTLKNLGGPESLSWMVKTFSDSSALLKHEVAYCLGQMGDPEAIPVLKDILQDPSKEPIVRHEAGEALAAIGERDGILDILRKHSKDPVPEVADTCELAVARMEYMKSDLSKTEKLSKNPYNSVDPAPPHTETDVKKLREILMDKERTLFERYRAMFSLRNEGSKESIVAIAESKGEKMSFLSPFLSINTLISKLFRFWKWKCLVQARGRLCLGTDSKRTRQRTAVRQTQRCYGE